MTHVAVDARFLGTGTGLDRYTRELLSALLARGDHDYTVLVRDPAGVDLDVPSDRLVRADLDHYSLGEHTRLPGLLRGTGADVALFPHFNAPAFPGLPYAATVHDTILHRFPGSASLAKRWAYRLVIGRAVRHADAVLAVSRWTAQCLVDEYGDRVRSRLSVTGEGVGEVFAPAPAEQVADARRRAGLTRDYLVYVGNAKPHKNLPTLVAAHRRSGVAADLALVSGDPEARSFVGDGVVLVPAVDDPMLAALYTGARAFVTASLEEGFCLPVVEALACGCPVIASDATAIPEAAAGHGRLVPPTVEALATALAEPVAPQPPVRVASWDDAAERTAKVLSSILTGSTGSGSKMAP